MHWHLLSATQVAPQPWRNGGGRTRELLAWPRADEWTLRVSVADIEADGPFSAFPGVQRWFAVLSGDGVRLGTQALRPGDPLHCFDGALAPDCALLGGATRDFNLMHRRERGLLHCLPVDGPWRARGAWAGLFSADGGTLRMARQSLVLPPLSLAWCAEPDAAELVFEGAGPAWWMHWDAGQ